MTEKISNSVYNNDKAGGNGKVTIKIPRPLYNKIAGVIVDGGYNSVTDFVVYVLRDLVTSHELAQNSQKNTKHNADVKDDTDAIKRRLRKLGYM